MLKVRLEDEKRGEGARLLNKCIAVNQIGPVLAMQPWF